jgi:hypothetical protein
LLAGDGNFRLFFVVHFDHEGGFKPRNDFFDVMNVDQIRAVRTPKRVGGESVEEFFEGAVVGGALDFASGDGDEAAFDGSEDEIFGVDEKHALLGFHEYLVGLRGGGFGAGKLGDELLKALGRTDGGIDFSFGALNGFGDAGLVKGLQDVVDGVHVESLYGVLVEGSGENNVRHFEFTLDEFLQDAEAVEAGHLHVEKNEIGRMFLDEVDGFETIFALAEKIDLGKGFEEKGEFIASGFFVVDDNGVDGHGYGLG